MSRQQGIDNLLEIKNAFYIGNYQNCINEAQNLRVNDSQIKFEVDSFLYRSYIAQKKYALVLSELQGSCHDHLKPLILLAEYFSAEDTQPVIKNLEGILSNDIDTTNELIFITGGVIYYNEENYEAALQILRQCDSLECSALSLQIYLKMDRIDLARKELKIIQDKDEDAILCQLSQAWVNIAMGGEKLDDAYYIFQEIIDKHGMTPLLLNGQAICFIHQGKLEEAESALQQAMSKDPSNADSLINFIVFSRILGKPQEHGKRYLLQLQEFHKNHPFIKEYNVKEVEFNKLVLQYSASVK